MRIGIDISQLAYSGTGVSNSIGKLIESLTETDKNNQYILFASTLRQKNVFEKIRNKYKDKINVSFKIFPFPQTFFRLIWNKLHILPIEWFIGPVDVFISSDWVEPPSRTAKKVTFIHDLVVYKYPKETHSSIVKTQKRKLFLSARECEAFICPSEATKKDASEILGISKEKIHVVAWGA